MVKRCSDQYMERKNSPEYRNRPQEMVVGVIEARDDSGQWRPVYVGRWQIRRPFRQPQNILDAVYGGELDRVFRGNKRRSPWAQRLMEKHSTPEAVMERVRAVVIGVMPRDMAKKRVKELRNENKQR